MNERDKLSQNIDELFQKAGAPDSRPALELKEELLANCIERYNDLVAGGMEQETALTSVSASIGNVDELVASLPPDATLVQLNQMEHERRQRSAIMGAIATALYILAGLVMVVGQFFGNWLYAFSGGIIIAIIPTCLLVYNSIAYPKYKKGDDTVVEQLKAMSADTKRAKTIKTTLSVMLWCLTLVVYFAMSFITMAWALTWLIFLVGVCLQAALFLAFALKEK